MSGALGAALAMLALAASPPSASRAQALAAKAEWDTLLLEFATPRASGGSVKASKDALTIAKALGRGCAALRGKEWPLAYGLGEKSVAWHPTPEGMACLSDAAVATEQSGAAEDVLRAGVARFPKDSGLRLRLARRLLAEQDAGGVLRLLGPLLKGRESRTARPLWMQARTLQKAQEGERVKQAVASSAASEASAGPNLTYRSAEGPDGYRLRSNDRFTIKYANRERDFAQRANYEGQIVAALDEAHDFTERTLGRARASSVDVVLYSREEFSLHFGASSALVLAGVYKENAIRINNAATWTPENKATLVHEYVHAAMDELSGFQMQRLPVWLNEGIAEYVEWRYQGSDRPPLAQRTALRAEARRHALTPLHELASGALVATAHPELSYAESGVAVQLLLHRMGVDAFLAFVARLGGKKPAQEFEEALRADYGVTLEELDRDLERELLQR